MSPKANSGPALLKTCIQARGLSLGKAAKEIGCSKTTLIFWLRGGQRPEYPRRRRISRWSRGDVPVRAWESQEERDIERGAKAVR